MPGTTTADWSGVDLFNPGEEYRMLRRSVRQFVEREVEPGAAARDREEQFDVALFRKLGELGLLGITVPEEWGGAGMDAVAAVIVHEELAASDPGLCLAYLAHAILFVNNLYRNGSDEQRARYLPKVISGEWIGGLAMTEPGAGTDIVGGMRTTARREGDGWVLNGRKMWITNGCLSDDELGDVFLVYARTDSGLISTFIVEKGFDGFSLGQRIEGKAGMRASNTAELVFDDCRVPAANLVGEEGGSLVHMMRNLEVERLTLAAMSLGIARRCLRIMNDYASERQAFGKPIRAFGQIQRYIARSYAEWSAGRTWVYDVARRVDLSRAGHRLETDGVKLLCAAMGTRVAHRAMQVLGGYGYVSEYVVERLWRDARLLEIGGGTLEAHERNIASDLGRHPEVLHRA